jgi:hypothetical protein
MVFNLDSIESGCHHKRSLFPADAKAMTLLLKHVSALFGKMTADYAELVDLGDVVDVLND